MAKMDHYENGKWVGSTEVQGHSNTTGWVQTYSSDGVVRSTFIENTDTFDYKGDSSNSFQSGCDRGGGSQIAAAIDDGVFLATVMIILAFILLPLSPVWYFIIKNKISTIKNQGYTPDKLLLTALTITKITFILQIVFLIIGVLFAVVSSSILLPFVLGDL